jgi:hypothetical protein
MTDDNREILKAISDLTKIVEGYHGDFREFRGEYSTKVEGLQKQTAEAKASSDRDRLWMKIHAVCVVPVVGGLHQLAQMLHWIK